MLKADVLAHFQGNGAAVARAIGITKGAVSQWRDIVPEAMAYRIERATNGALKVDPEVYIRASHPAADDSSHAATEATGCQ